MASLSSPDYDATNPNPELIHQSFDRENEAGVFENEPMDLSAFEDDLSGEDIDLYDPLDIDTFEDEIEGSRTEPGLGLIERTEFYPDEFLIRNSKEPDSVKKLSEQEAAIEEFYGGSTVFDPLGDEGSFEETRPAD